jgi:hypothetical protein
MAVNDRLDQLGTFCTLTPVRDEAALRAALASWSADPSPFAALDFVHFARFVVITDLPRADAGQPAESLPAPLLMFSCFFDGDRTALIDALRDGTITCVATDHAPHARHEKDAPFEAAPFGVTGLETAFASLYTRLVLPGVLPLETLLERMSAGPARIFGLERPRIAVGAPANLVLLDLDSEWTVAEDGFRSRSVNSWLLGERLRGATRATVAAGRLAYEA